MTTSPRHVARHDSRLAFFLAGVAVALIAGLAFSARPGSSHPLAFLAQPESGHLPVTHAGPTHGAWQHNTLISEDLPSAEQLDELSTSGWELVQIIPHTKGIRSIRPGQIAIYLRRPLSWSAAATGHKPATGTSTPDQTQTQGPNHDART